MSQLPDQASSGRRISESSPVADNDAFIVFDQRYSPKPPDIDEYQSLKSITVFDNSPAKVKFSSPGSSCLNLFFEHFSLQRSWVLFYSQRIQAALKEGIGTPVSMFPGDTLPPYKIGESPLYRGTLLFEQFVDLCFSVRHQVRDVLAVSKPADETWPWRNVDKPNVSLMDFSFADADEPEHILRSLGDQLHLDSSSFNSTQLLELVQRAWSKEAISNYADSALDAVEAIIASVGAESISLPLLFELESYAAHISAFRHAESLGSGIFANNWIEVGLIPLRDCRLTEACFPERVLEETFRLPLHSFAPLVVNEYDQVTDGNHRLIAVHLFNILQACHNCTFDIDDQEFQTRIAEAVSRQINSPAITHQVLGCLASILSSGESRARINRELKPALGKYAPVTLLPYVLLCEYSAGAVVKEPFDRSGRRVSLPLSLFQMLRENPGVLMPPRAAYHFTDRVLLPWFNILQERDD